MDADFLQELDQAISNVGTDVIWKRVIRGVTVWLSPISMINQQKVTETMGSDELGINVVNESKRVTLSHAIVGINEHDLSGYRDAGPIFQIPGKDGKPVKVDLGKYVYYKIGGWGAQFIDDTFTVYADLMETLQKENLKDIKFENTKDPKQELLEHMIKVVELRGQLGMPALIDPLDKPDPDKEELESKPELAPAPKVKQVNKATEEPFNPFKKISQEDIPDPAPRKIQLQAPPEVIHKSNTIAEVEQTSPFTSSGITKQAQPLQSTDILEEPSQAPKNPEPIQIDRPVGGINPRFKPTR